MHGKIGQEGSFIFMVITVLFIEATSREKRKNI
jgi:hypothetical protein